MTTEERAPEMVGGHVNAVVLRGRLSAPAEERELPSGDVVVTFRIVVDRERRAPARGRSTHDTIACATWRADVRRRALKVDAGEVLEVEGSLRRRFWRSPQGATSQYEVDVVRLRRPTRAR